MTMMIISDFTGHDDRSPLQLSPKVIRVISSIKEETRKLTNNKRPSDKPDSLVRGSRENAVLQNTIIVIILY